MRHDALVDRAEDTRALAPEHLDAHAVAEMQESRDGLPVLDLLEHPSFRQARRTAGAVVVRHRARPDDGCRRASRRVRVACAISAGKSNVMSVAGVGLPEQLRR